jgi:hypothetical protein
MQLSKHREGIFEMRAPQRRNQIPSEGLCVNCFSSHGSKFSHKASKTKMITLIYIIARKSLSSYQHSRSSKISQKVCSQVKLKYEQHMTDFHEASREQVSKIQKLVLHTSPS